MGWLRNGFAAVFLFASSSVAVADWSVDDFGSKGEDGYVLIYTRGAPSFMAGTVTFRCDPQPSARTFTINGYFREGPADVTHIIFTDDDISTDSTVKVEADTQTAAVLGAEVAFVARRIPAVGVAEDILTKIENAAQPVKLWVSRDNAISSGDALKEMPVRGSTKAVREFRRLCETIWPAAAQAATANTSSQEFDWLNAMSDSALSTQLFDDIYDGLPEEVATEVQIIASRGKTAHRIFTEDLVSAIQIVIEDHRDSILSDAELILSARAYSAAIEALVKIGSLSPDDRAKIAERTETIRLAAEMSNGKAAAAAILATLK